MYAQCPHCQTLFRLSSAQLTAADAKVRCGQCFTVFNALDNLRVLSEEEETALAAGIELEAPDAHRTTEGEAASEVPQVLEEDLGDLKKTQEPRYTRRSTVLYSLGILGLLLLLGIQFLYLERARLVHYPETTGLVLGLCDILNCDLSALRDTRQIDLLSRQLYTHPNVEEALMIRGTMVNNAPYPQDYPLLELSLSDEQGRVVAMRRFAPMEYLAVDEDPLAEMAPGAPVAINLEIADPGENALAFEFGFL